MIIEIEEEIYLICGNRPGNALAKVEKIAKSISPRDRSEDWQHDFIASCLGHGLIVVPAKIHAINIF